MNEAIAEAFRRDAMEEAYEQTLWLDFVEATKLAQETLDLKDGRYARKAYTRFLRSSLTDVERQLVEAEGEIIALRAENKLLRERQKPSLAVPKWRDPP